MKQINQIREVKKVGRKRERKKRGKRVHLLQLELLRKRKVRLNLLYQKGEISKSHLAIPCPPLHLKANIQTLTLSQTFVMRKNIMFVTRRNRLFETRRKNLFTTRRKSLFTMEMSHLILR